MSGLVVAIDGPAGSGKSSTAGAVAQILGLGHLDSGALYRSMALIGIDSGNDPGSPGLVKAARDRCLQLCWDGTHFCAELDGRPVGDEIRQPRINKVVSRYASETAVRNFVNGLLRSAAGRHPVGVVMDGRDIGTVVFPDADLKIFLVADIRERARRRLLEASGQLDDQELAETVKELTSRDLEDSTRASAPLARAPDAVELDTTHLTFQTQVNRILDLARSRLALA